MKRSGSLAVVAVILLSVAFLNAFYAHAAAQSLHYFIADLFAVAGVSALMMALIDRDWVIGASQAVMLVLLLVAFA